MTTNYQNNNNTMNKCKKCEESIEEYATRWELVSVGYEFDVKARNFTGKRKEYLDVTNFQDWSCSNCGEELTKEQQEELEKLLEGDNKSKLGKFKDAECGDCYYAERSMTCLHFPKNKKSEKLVQCSCGYPDDRQSHECEQESKTGCTECGQEVVYSTGRCELHQLP